MSRILIIYSTTDGQTLKICQRLQTLVSPAHHVQLLSIDEVGTVDLAEFDKIVIGASIRYGRHNPKVAAFVAQHRQLLDSKANAFFSVNVVARKPAKSQPQTNPYLQRFLKQIAWKPQHLAVFAGKLDYPSYSSLDRWVIRLIMWITRGPTDPNTVIEFTDWEQVAAFATVIDQMQ